MSAILPWLASISLSNGISASGAIRANLPLPGRWIRTRPATTCTTSSTRVSAGARLRNSHRRRDPAAFRRPRRLPASREGRVVKGGREGVVRPKGLVLGAAAVPRDDAVVIRQSGRECGDLGETPPATPWTWEASFGPSRRRSQCSCRTEVLRRRFVARVGRSLQNRAGLRHVRGSPIEHAGRSRERRAHTQEQHRSHRHESESTLRGHPGCIDLPARALHRTFVRWAGPDHPETAEGVRCQRQRAAPSSDTRENEGVCSHVSFAARPIASVTLPSPDP